MSIFLTEHSRVVVQGLTGGEGTKHATKMLAAGTDIVDRWVAATPGVAWVKPEIGFGCIELPPSVGDDIAFAETLHDKHGVLTAPGAYFELPGHLRVSWSPAWSSSPSCSSQALRARQSSESRRLDKNSARVARTASRRVRSW